MLIVHDKSAACLHQLELVYAYMYTVLRPLNTTQDRRNVLLDQRVGENEIIDKNAGGI